MIFKNLEIVYVGYDYFKDCLRDWGSEYWIAANKMFFKIEKVVKSYETDNYGIYGTLIFNVITSYYLVIFNLFLFKSVYCLPHELKILKQIAKS